MVRTIIKKGAHIRYSVEGRNYVKHFHTREEFELTEANILHNPLDKSKHHLHIWAKFSLYVRKNVVRYPGHDYFMFVFIGRKTGRLFIAGVNSKYVKQTEDDWNKLDGRLFYQTSFSTN